MIYWVAANGTEYHRNPACPGLASEQAKADAQPGGEPRGMAHHRSEDDAREAALDHVRCSVRGCFPPATIRGLGWGLLTLSEDMGKGHTDPHWREREAD